MSSLKSILTCPQCLKIYKEPFILPCGDSLCKEHLDEKSNEHLKLIKCLSCLKEFEINSSSFVLNKVLNDLIVNETFLSYDEKTCKMKIIESFTVIKKLSDEYYLMKSSLLNLETENRNHFEQIRFQIEKHRVDESFNTN